MLEELLKNLGAAIPKLAAALALVLIGYIIAKVVRRVVTACTIGRRELEDVSSRHFLKNGSFVIRQSGQSSLRRSPDGEREVPRSETGYTPPLARFRTLPCRTFTNCGGVSVSIRR